MNAKRIMVALLLFGVSACATPPKELVEARETYQSVKEGPAAQYAPAQLKDAEEALALAEKAFDKEGDDEITRALSYVAIRKSQIAVVEADIFLAKEAKTERERELLETSERARKKLQNTAQKTAQELEAERIRLENAKKDLEESKKRGDLTAAELKEKQDALAKEQAALAQTKERLAQEKKAREEAQAKLAETRKKLEEIASIKDEKKKMVITLSGSVLFASGKHELLQAAKLKLDQVAEVLLAERDAEMIVEGHTDSQGSDSSNMALSQKRADSVRSYLVSQGIASDRLKAVGKGESNPIASNDNAEGRANNRRVEIVVNRK